MKLQFRRAVALVLAVLLCFVLTACTSGKSDGDVQTQTGVTTSAVQQGEEYAPVVQENGDKLRIGVLDIDPYEPASTYLYYVLQGLKNEGWITFDSLPFDETSMDIKSMVQELAQMDLGPYVEFVSDAVYYLAYEDEADIVANMHVQIESEKGLDIILAMGTDPGLFMKKYDIPVNTLVCMATDPVASGIINSVDDSGDPKVWAQVEPAPYYRQIKFYHNIYPFENVGMVYSDAVVAGIPDYQNGADELGITITGVQISDDWSTETAEGIKAYTEYLMGVYKDLIKSGIDAYVLNADLLTGDMDVAALIEPFNAAGIPVFVQDGENYVREGALLLVASTDNQGVGQFVAEVIAKVAHGVRPGDISCEYVSSPYMSINLGSAKNLGFRPSFELLLSCETIYTEGN